MKYLFIFLMLSSHTLSAQVLHLKPRKADAVKGTEFAKSIAARTITLQQRENIIFKEIKDGNVPNFLRKLTKITDSIELDLGIGKVTVSYYVLPDYFCIGSDDDYFYVPMTPILAQKVANLTKCSLATRRIVDKIYENAVIKLEPKPIPPTKAMITLPVFIAHTDSVKTQLADFEKEHHLSKLTAGNKKDIIISNKIYGEKSPRVVIYGWHKLNGKPIQPVYNKHINTWADYSHGVRLVQNTLWVNGKKTTLAKILADAKLSVLLSDEGKIEKPYYPVTTY